MPSNYVALREKALANFEILLNFWKIDYKKISPIEYDFLNPTRKDTNFGACRFNIQKGFGADFAKQIFTESDFKSFGKGFTASDFAAFSEYGETNPGFDIIGLAQRIYKLNTYAQAAAALENTLKKISEDTKLIEITQAQIDRRERQIKEGKEKRLSLAQKLWSVSKELKNTPGEVYFQYRSIVGIKEPNIRFHYNVWNTELKLHIPCIVFKISKSYDGDLQAVHRIYIARDGTRKAYLNDVKLALGEIKHGAIWFGEPNTKLYIVEGPEEALSVRYGAEKEFVCSTVYSNNFHNIIIPPFVHTIVLCPDDMDGGAGKSAAIRALKEYSKLKGVKIKIAPLDKEAVYSGQRN